MITTENYFSKTQNLDFSSLPAPLIQGNTLTQKALSNDQSAYQTNETIKRVVDTYIEKLNSYLANQGETVKTQAKPAKKTPVKKKAVPKEKTRTAAPVKQRIEKLAAKDVEMIPIEISFIRRYLVLHGKVHTRKRLLTLLNSLQKAMLEKRIRKTSPFAKDILKIQDQLIMAIEQMEETAEINLSAQSLEHYRSIASSTRIRDSIALLKRFLSIHGKSGVQDKAARLKSAMEKWVKSGRITENDPYAKRLNQAYKATVIYLKEKQESPRVASGELNGIHSLVSTAAPNKKPKAAPSAVKETMNSQELLKLNFQTIGLTGKFRNLIGDPSVGFMAMVFGQPKSGKSTLMLEFAHHLAKHHGNVLYAAIEEGYGYTLKEKIQRVGAAHPRLSVAEQLPKSLKEFDIVFIDSVSRAGMELQDLIQLRKKNPKTSFIFIFHATKEGKFRGGNEYAHEVDVIINVEPGVARASGRFNGGGELKF